MNSVLFLGILLVLGLLSTRLMKVLKLPNVTGFLIIGLLASIVCIVFDSFSNTTLTNDLSEMNSYVSLVALGFIALSIGEELKISKIKSYGAKMLTITFFQALTAVLFVDVSIIILCLILKLNLSIAIMLGAIATATAPAATLMVINQYKAKGKLVDILLPVVALDDAIGLIVYTISVGICKVIVTGDDPSFLMLGLLPLIDIFGSLILGGILGILMRLFIRYFKSRNNHEVTIIAFTILGVGLCKLFNTIKFGDSTLEFSNLLCCMMIGFSHINLARSDESRNITVRDIELIDRWTPFLFMLFFVLSGCHLGISAYEVFKGSNNLFVVLLIFAFYLIFRSAGKIFGAFMGSKVTKQDKDISKYLGITLLPQAGVAIGMANSISSIDVFKTDNIGSIIVTVVLCATLIYEIVGPLLTKWSLNKMGEIPDDNGVYPCENKGETV